MVFLHKETRTHRTNFLKVAIDKSPCESLTFHEGQTKKNVIRGLASYHYTDSCIVIIRLSKKNLPSKLFVTGWRHAHQEG